jgi:hypothetical protein
LSASVTLIAFAILAKLLSFDFAIVTRHLSLAFVWRLAQTVFAWNPA